MEENFFNRKNKPGWIHGEIRRKIRSKWINELGNIIESLKDWEEIKRKMKDTVKRYSPIVK